MKYLPLIAILFLTAFVQPSAAHAAFNFQYIDMLSSGDEAYNAVEETKLSEAGPWLSQMLIDHPTKCAAAAAAAGLSDTDDYWCVAAHESFPNIGGCVYTCQQGLAAAGPGATGFDRTTWLIYEDDPGVYDTRDDYAAVPPGDTEAGMAVFRSYDCSPMGYVYSCSLFKHTPAQVPVAAIASISANPVAVTSGNASVLTYSCLNATSGSITGIGAITADGQSHTVSTGALSATATTTVNFTLTCVGSGGNGSAIATVTVTPAPPANRPPVGSIDSVDNTACTVSGWAQDPDVPSTAIDVHLYANGAVGAGGTFMGSVSANVSRANLCAQYGCNHAFSFAVPAAFKDGVARTVYAYGIDSAGGPNPQLSNSGAYSIQCAVPASQADLRPTGFSPNVVVSGAPYTYTGTVSNDGATATGPFNSRAYVCLESDLDCQNRSYLAAGEPQGFFARVRAFFLDVAHAAAASPVLSLTRLSSLAANAQNVPQTVAHTFPASTTDTRYVVKYCVDNPAPHEVAESDETDNCGGWQVLTVCAEGSTVSGSGCVPPPSGSLSCTVNGSASPVTVTAPATVTYAASGATAPYSWVPPDGTTGYGTGSSATRSFTVSQLGTYAMEVRKSGYDAGNCPLVTVNNGVAACPTPDGGTLTASPNRVQASTPTPVTFSYRGTNVDTSCTVAGPSVSRTFTAASCSVNPGTFTETISIPTQSTYTLTCDGTPVAEAIVNVVPTIIEP